MHKLRFSLSVIADIILPSVLPSMSAVLSLICSAHYIRAKVLLFIHSNHALLDTGLTTGSPFPRNRTKPDETDRNRVIIVVIYVTINCYKKLLALLYSIIFIGPDFQRAMVATGPGETLLIGCRSFLACRYLAFSTCLCVSGPSTGRTRRKQCSL